jgi:hypothetical protein
LRFPFDFAISFTHNQAEQSIRTLEPRSGSKAKTKMSEDFRTKLAAGTFATIRSAFSTRENKAGIF